MIAPPPLVLNMSQNHSGPSRLGLLEREAFTDIDIIVMHAGLR